MTTPADHSTKTRIKTDAEREAELARVFAKSDALWQTEFFQKHIAAAMGRFLEERQGDFVGTLHGDMRRMDSPLEAAFMAWWRAIYYRMDSVYLCSQFEVKLSGRSYRLDFAVRPSPYDGWMSALVDHPLCPKIAIELDGHDFHEKTKEQVTHRNRRDRDLQADGWIVLHVSGSEFNANPEAVATEIYERASSLLYAACHRLRG